MKTTVDSIALAIQGFTKFTDIVGGIPALLTTAVVAMALFSAKARASMSNILGSVKPIQGPLMVGQSNLGLAANIPIINKMTDAINAYKTAYQNAANISARTSLINFGASIYNKIDTVIGGMANKITTAMSTAKSSVKNFFSVATFDKVANSAMMNGKAFETMGNSIKSMGVVAGNVAKSSIAGLIGGLKSLVTLSKLATLATIGLQTALSLVGAVAFTLAFTAIYKVVDNLIHKEEKAKQKLDELKNSVQQLRSETAETDKLSVSYNELSNKTNLTTKEKEKLYQVTERLASLYPGVVEGYDAEGKVIKLNNALLKEYLDLKKEESKDKQDKLQTSYFAKGDEQLKNLENYEKKINNIKNKINKEEILLKATIYEDKKSDINEKILKYQEEISKLKGEMKTTFDDLTVELQSFFQEDQRFKDLGNSGLLLLIKSVIKESNNLGLHGTKNIKDFIDKLGNVDISSIGKKFQESIKSYQTGDISYDDLLQAQAVAVQKFNEELNKSGVIGENNLKPIRDLFLLLPEEIKNATNGIINYLGAIEKIEEKTNSTVSTIELYNQILEKSKESNNDAAQEVLKHAKDHEELKDVITAESGVLVLNVSKLEELKTVTIKEATEAINKQIIKTDKVEEETKKRLKQYNIEIAKLEELSVERMSKLYEERKGSLDYEYQYDPLNPEKYKKDIGLIQELNNAYVLNQLKTIKKTKENGQKLLDYWYKLEIGTKNPYGSQKEIDERTSYIQSLIEGVINTANEAEKSIAILDAPNLGIKDSKESSKEISTAKSEESLAWENVTNKIKEYDNALKALENYTEKTIKGSEDRRNSLHAENLKIKEQIEYLKQQKDLLSNNSVDSVDSNVYTPTLTGKAKGVLDIAMSALGTPYKWGGNDLKIGVDCSGLVQQTYKEVGIDVPRTADEQYYQAPIKPSKAELQTGDLVFFDGSDPPYGHVGIYMGSDKFIEAPHTGANVRISSLSSRSDYAGAGRYPGTNIGDLSSFSKSELSIAKIYEDREKHIEEINAKLLELEKHYEENSTDWWKSYVTEYNDKIKVIDDSIDFSTSKMQNLDFTSKEYADELNIQINKLKEKQELYKQEKLLIDDAIKSGKLYGDDLIEYIEKGRQLSADWWDLQKQIGDKSFDLVKLKLDDADLTIEKIRDQLNLANTTLDMQIKGTNEYNNALSEMIKLTGELEIALKKKQNIAEEELNNDQLNIQQKRELTKTIEDLKNEILSQQAALNSRLQSLADEIISIYKEMYNKQKDIALDTIDKQIKAEEDRHNETIKNLDEELDKYEEIINTKLKALEDKENEEDYNKQLNELQKEKQETLDQINVLALDDSLEARAKLTELNKKLSEQDKKIEEFKIKHSRELQKKNLKDQLDLYKKDIDRKKEAEDEKYNIEKENLEEIRKDIEKYWNEKINDERKYLEIRRQILSGNLSQVESDFASFGVFLDRNMKDIGKSISEGLIDKMKSVITEAKNVQAELANIKNEVNNINAATNNYASIIAQMKANANAWPTASESERQRLHEENLKLGALLPGAYYDENTGKWYDPNKNNLFTSTYYDNLNQVSNNNPPNNQPNNENELYNKYWEMAKNNGYAYFWIQPNGGSKKYYWTDTGGYIGSSEPSQSKIDAHYGNNNNSPNNNSPNNNSPNNNSPADGTESNPYLADGNWYGSGYYKSKKTGKKKYYSTDADYYYGSIRWNEFHDGGIVNEDNNPPSKIMQIVNKLFNVKPGEQIVKSLIGELQVPPKNILNNFIPNMQNLINSINPQPVLVGSNSSNSNSNSSNITLNVYVDNMNANNKKHVEEVFSVITNGLKKMGI